MPRLLQAKELPMWAQEAKGSKKGAVPEYSESHNQPYKEELLFCFPSAENEAQRRRATCLRSQSWGWQRQGGNSGRLNSKFSLST